MLSCLLENAWCPTPFPTLSDFVSSDPNYFLFASSVCFETISLYNQQDDCNLKEAGYVVPTSTSPLAVCRSLRRSIKNHSWPSGLSCVAVEYETATEAKYQVVMLEVQRRERFGRVIQKHSWRISPLTWTSKHK